MFHFSSFFTTQVPGLRQGLSDIGVAVTLFHLFLNFLLKRTIYQPYVHRGHGIALNVTLSLRYLCKGSRDHPSGVPSPVLLLRPGQWLVALSIGASSRCKQGVSRSSQRLSHPMV